jgi:rhombotail lipoprotein
MRRELDCRGRHPGSRSATATRSPSRSACPKPRPATGARLNEAGHGRIRWAGSIVDFLYPKASSAPALAPTVTELHLPVRVGIAFVPGSNRGTTMSEQEKHQMLERVKAAFSSHAFIGKIEVIPSSYLRAGGGFENLDQVSRMFDVDVVALLSYDQVRFNDTNAAAPSCTGPVVGAYHDPRRPATMCRPCSMPSVFDVKSRKLLFRAPGTSQVKGSGDAGIGFTEGGARRPVARTITQPGRNA